MRFSLRGEEHSGWVHQLLFFALIVSGFVADKIGPAVGFVEIVPEELGFPPYFLGLDSANEIPSIFPWTGWVSARGPNEKGLLYFFLFMNLSHNRFEEDFFAF